MSNLQKLIGQFGCSVLNYTEDKLIVNYFYSEEMYNKYLHGVDCMQGMGVRDTTEVLEFNQLPDKILVIVQHRGCEKARYQYFTKVRATIKYKEMTKDGKKDRSLSFRIRKNKYGSGLNYLDSNGKAFDYNNLQELKSDLTNRYGKNKIKDWVVLDEKDAIG